MSKQSMVLRDLIESVVTGSTVKSVYTTATDYVRSVITELSTDTPWSNTVYEYEISGYTVSQSAPSAITYSFYVNTGATMITLSTGNTLLSTYITSGSTVPTGTTVTEVPITTTGITTTYRNAVNIALDGGSTGTITIPGDVEIIGDLYVSGNTYEQDQYITDELIIGTAGAQGSWRFIHDTGSDNLLVQIYSGATWVTKSQFIV